MAEASGAGDSSHPHVIAKPRSGCGNLVPHVVVSRLRRLRYGCIIGANLVGVNGLIWEIPVK